MQRCDSATIAGSSRLSKSPTLDRQSPDSHAESSTFEEQKSAISQETVTLFRGMRMPDFIDRLAPLALDLPHQPNYEFPFNFLKNILGGTAQAGGTYILPTKSTRGRLFPYVRQHRIIDPGFKPLLPRRSGQHGALVSSCLSDADLANGPFPLFIRHGRGGYKYYGNYWEPRFSDRLSGNEMKQVPGDVKRYWAQRMGAYPIDGKSAKVRSFGE
jgi:hypothetical protein